MKQAIIDQVAIDLACKEQGIFRVNGSIVSDPGFLQVYEESVSEEQTVDNNSDLVGLGIEKQLPNLTLHEQLAILDIRAEQHFTEPPPRYSEASLVKALEEYGIGRPSTYATIISTLQQRKYAFLESGRFKPTDVAVVVNKFLTNYFERYVDYGFTAKLEDLLDEIARGEAQWIPVLKNFWEPFIELIKNIDVSVKRSDVTHEQLEENCPSCGKILSMRLGKSGKFIGCTGFPECDYTRSIDITVNQQQPEILPDRLCPECNHQLIIKTGRYGKFIGCSNYPACRFIESLHKKEVIDITCPICTKGHFVKRKSRYGTFFYACSDYPHCKYAIKGQPIKENCPNCNWPFLVLKETKKNGSEKICPKEACGFTEKI